MSDGELLFRSGAAAGFPVRLRSPADRAGALDAIARMVTLNVSWDEAQWHVDQDFQFAFAPTSLPATLRRLPRAFVDVANLALLHGDEDRFLRVHRMAQRLHADPAHWDDVLHPEHTHLQSLARQVRRDMHKMKAFVRFTRVGTRSAGDVESQAEGKLPGGERPDAHSEYAAWFEPQYYVVQAVGDFFVRRFASMRWAILTPYGSLRWDGHRLEHGPAARAADAPAPDAGEALWLTYYARIFNPARVKLAAMRREMPVRYWKHLPEAGMLPGLIAQAPQRVAEMVSRSEMACRTAGNVRGKAPGAPGRRVCGAASDEPSIDGLASIRSALHGCLDCEFALQATQPVAGTGPRAAQVVFVGEQPGDHEDLSGRPFTGPSGALLRQALARLRIDPETVYLTNAVKHFRYEMRGKRRIHKTPAQRDVERCAQWLEREMAELDARVIVALGRTAQTALERLFEPPSTGDWQTDRCAIIGVVAHPAALLRAGESAGSPGFLRWTAQIGALVQRGLVVDDVVTADRA